jgi:hypothetical protein
MPTTVVEVVDVFGASEELIVPPLLPTDVGIVVVVVVLVVVVEVVDATVGTSC